MTKIKLVDRHEHGQHVLRAGIDRLSPSTRWHSWTNSSAESLLSKVSLYRGIKQSVIKTYIIFQTVAERGPSALSLFKWFYYVPWNSFDTRTWSPTEILCQGVSEGLHHENYSEYLTHLPCLPVCQWLWKWGSKDFVNEWVNDILTKETVLPNVQPIQ